MVFNDPPATPVHLPHQWLFREQIEQRRLNQVQTAHDLRLCDGHLERNQAAIGMPDEMKARDPHGGRNIQ
jgi:hypothetical protein